MQTPALSPVLHDQLKWKALIDKSALFLDRNLVQLHPGLSCGEAAPGIAQYLSTFKQWAYEKPEAAVRVLRRPVIRPDVQLLRLAIVAEGGD